VRVVEIQLRIISLRREKKWQVPSPNVFVMPVKQGSKMFSHDKVPEKSIRVN